MYLDPATGSLCAAHRASSDARFQRQFCVRADLALHEWTGITAKEKQPSSSAMCRHVGRTQVRAPVQGRAAGAGSTDRRQHVQRLWRKCA